MEGKVKWFDGVKGFGFISGEDEKEYFVHHSQILNHAELNEGDDVNFEVVETPKGMQAQKVEKLQG